MKRFAGFSLSLIVASLPLFHLYIHNRDQLPPASKEVFLLTLLTLITLHSALFIGIRALKDAATACYTTTLFWIVFHGYGHAFQLLGTYGLARHRYTLPAALILLWIANQIVRRLKPPIGFMNTVATVLALLVIIPAISHSDVSNSKGKVNAPTQTQSQTERKLPNIYYILLDMYPSEQVLKTFYQYDNQTFLASLKNKGFHIINDSYANYPFTLPSMASLLNMEYLPSTKLDIPLSNEWVRNNRVATIARELGYKFVVFSSIHPFNEIRNADINTSCTRVDPFLVLTLRTSLLSFLESRVSQTHWAAQRRKNLECVLGHLESSEKLKGPKFVFTHILSPHPPFTHGENGEAVEMSEFSLFPMVHNKEDVTKASQMFLNQTKYISKRIDAITSTLIEDDDPIIIIQSDHGPYFSDAWIKGTWEAPNPDMIYERMSVFNAWRAPRRMLSALPERSSLVNTFRFLFHHEFGMDLKPLHDRVYFSDRSWGTPMNFLQVDPTDFKPTRLSPPT